MSKLLVGTSSWSKPEWAGSFYPPGTPARGLLSHYATRFRTVEIDSTWYRCSTPRAVDGWRENTPDGFVFSAKAPRTITHVKHLNGCDVELNDFLTVMRRLGDRLGPILFQLPCLRRAEVPDLAAFVVRLEQFLPLLPSDLRFVIEVRNRSWLQPPLFEVLRAHGVALAWVDDPRLPGAAECLRTPAAQTADFLYIRLLGEHPKEEPPPAVRPEPLRDRTEDTLEWVDLVNTVAPRVSQTYLYASQRFAGNAPGTADLVVASWEKLQQCGPG